MRRPSLQFYPGDWQSNPKLRRCSHSEKGIWLDVLCILHDQDEYGIIRWPLKDLALAVHAKSAALQAIVDKEVLKGADAGHTCEAFIYVPRHGGKDGTPVTLIPAQEGPIWYSSRMVRDEHIRQARATNEPKPKNVPKLEPKGGNGTGLGQAAKPDPSRAGASSSSSSSSSTAEKKEEKQEKRTAKPRDPRLDHPALKAVVEAKGSYPVKETWDLVIRIVGDSPDLDRMRDCWVTWRTKGYKPTSLDWLVDWYVNGIPERQIQRNGTRETASQRNVRNIRESLEYIDGLQEPDSPTDIEVPTRLLASRT